jgi:hypothetical protein
MFLQRPVYSTLLRDTYLICILCHFHEIWALESDSQWNRRIWSRIILEPSEHMFWSWNLSNHLFVHRTSDLISFRIKTCVLVAS